MEKGTHTHKKQDKHKQKRNKEKGNKTQENEEKKKKNDGTKKLSPEKCDHSGRLLHYCSGGTTIILQWRVNISGVSVSPLNETMHTGQRPPSRGTNDDAADNQSAAFERCFTVRACVLALHTHIE